MYQDGAVQISDLAYSFAAPDTSTVTFTATKDGAPFDVSRAESVGIYFVPWTGEKFQFEPAVERVTLKGDLTCDDAGRCTSVLAGGPADVSGTDGLVVLYGRDETAGRLPARVYQAKYPVCGRCWKRAPAWTTFRLPTTQAAKSATPSPFLKHGYIYGQTSADPATDFLHLQGLPPGQRRGRPFRMAARGRQSGAWRPRSSRGGTSLTPEQEAQYAYRTTLMNDVHMSHAMEFPYPQSMSNCVTCHEGKLDNILTDENFIVMRPARAAIAVTGVRRTVLATVLEKKAPALAAILPASVPPMHLDGDGLQRVPSGCRGRCDVQ